MRFRRGRVTVQSSPRLATLEVLGFLRTLGEKSLHMGQGVATHALSCDRCKNLKRFTPAVRPYGHFAPNGGAGRRPEFDCQQ